MRQAIERSLAGDAAAAELVVRRVGRIALPLATAVLGSRDDAADVAQDVAVDVLRSLHRLRNADSFDGWVRRIAVRATLRAAKERRRRTGAEVALEQVDVVAAGAADDGAEALALRDALRTALVELSPRQRIALALRYVHGLSDAEIAATIGCRPGTAAALLSRGRELLRQHAALAQLAPTTPRRG